MLSLFPCNAEVTIFSSNKTDDFGLNISDSTGVLESCRLSFNTEYKKIENAKGEEIIFTATLLFPKRISIKVDDKVKFKDDLGSFQTKSVKLVQFKRDFANNVLAVKAVI